VNDPVSVSQLASYHHATPQRLPMLYLPGLSGLLYEHDSAIANVWLLTCRSLADAQSQVELGHFIGAYVDDVRREEAWLAAAKAAVTSGGPLASEACGHTRAKEAEDAAWLALVGADRPGVSRACEGPPICSAVEQPEQEIGQQDDLARCGRIVVLNLSVTARVLEHARS